MTMLYESDLSDLLSKWQERLNMQIIDSSYKDAVSDCIYDLRCLMDKNFADEALAQESFNQQLLREENWDDWFAGLISGEPCPIP